MELIEGRRRHQASIASPGTYSGHTRKGVGCRKARYILIHSQIRLRHVRLDHSRRWGLRSKGSDKFSRQSVCRID